MRTRDGVRKVVVRCGFAAGVVVGVAVLAACQASASAAAAASAVVTQGSFAPVTSPSTTAAAAPTAVHTQPKPAAPQVPTHKQPAPPAASGPVKFPDSCGDSATRVEPPEVDIACDSSIVLKQANWTAWTATQANGTGTLSVDNCSPDCADGTYQSYSVSLQLSHPTNTSCGQFFEDLDVTFSGSAPSTLPLTTVDGNTVWQAVTPGSLPGDLCSDQ